MSSRFHLEHKHITCESNQIPDMLHLLDDGWRIIWSDSSVDKFHFILGRQSPIPEDRVFNRSGPSSDIVRD